MGILLVLAASLALLPPMFVPVLLGSVAFFALLKAGGKRFNLIVTLLLLQLTSSSLDPTMRVAVIGWSFISLAWFGFVDREKTDSTVFPKNLLYLMLSTIVFMVFSSLLSVNMVKSLSATLRQGVFFVFVWLILLNIRNEKDIKTSLVALILMGGFNAAGVVYSILTGGITAGDLLAGPVRFAGIFGFINVNFSGMTIAFAAMIALLLFHLSDRSNRSARIAFGTLTGFLFTTVIIFNSRAAMLTAMLGLVVFLLILYPRYRLPFTVAIISIPLAIFIIPPLNEFVSLLLRFENFLNVRDYLWGMSWASIQDHPFLGTGPDLFKDYFYKYMTAPEGSYAHYMITKLYLEASDSGLSHNFFLFRFTELGIPGLITSIWLPALFYRYSIPVMKSLKESDRTGYILVAGMVALVSGLLAKGMVESIGFMTHGWIMVDLPFWICFITVLFYYRKNGQTRKEIL